MAWLTYLARNILHDEPPDNPLLTPVTVDLIRKVCVDVGPSDIILPLSYTIHSCYASAQRIDFSTSTKSKDMHSLKDCEHPKHCVPFLRINAELSDWEALSNRSLTPPWIPSIGPGKVPDLKYPTLIPEVSCSPKCNPDQDFSFCFSPVALTPTCQRHQRLFNSLGCALPAVVNWSTMPALEVSSASCTSLESYVEITDAGGYHPVTLPGSQVRRKNLRPLARWAMCLFGRRTDAIQSPS
jgi:hypothetical protein